MLPPRSLMLLQMVPMLVLFVGSVIRLPDVAFDVTLATYLDSADGAAMLLFAAAVMVFMVQMWHHSAGRLLTASMLSVLSFAAVKGYADSLDVPHLICKSRAPQIRPGPVPCMTLVTGANSGIGKATAQLLAQQGHVVIMACRSNASCAVAAEEIKQSTDKGTIIPMGGLDLASLEATRAWAAQVTGKVDYLFNNAGVIPTGAVTTGDGLELGLGVSYVGHLALSRWLLAAGVRAARPTTGPRDGGRTPTCRSVPPPRAGVDARDGQRADRVGRGPPRQPAREPLRRRGRRRGRPARRAHHGLRDPAALLRAAEASRHAPWRPTQLRRVPSRQARQRPVRARAAQAAWAARRLGAPRHGGHACAAAHP